MLEHIGYVTWQVRSSMRTVTLLDMEELERMCCIQGYHVYKEILCKYVLAMLLATARCLADDLQLPVCESNRLRKNSCQ